MKFKILNAHKSNGTLFITGCYIPKKSEAKLLDYLRITLDEVNVTMDGNVWCKRLVSNDKTILFKSISIETVYSVLLLQNKSFNLHLVIELGKNMQNNPFKQEVEQYFLEHKLQQG